MAATARFQSILQLLSFCLCAASGVAAQGLFAVPSTMTHELGAYYISKLKEDLSYYSLLTGRNVLGVNAYNIINGLPDNLDPMEAAFRTSSVRGTYKSWGIGGRVKVDVFYKLVRCPAFPDCSTFDRVLITSSPVAGLPDLLTVVKATIPGTGWQINANQTAVNAVLNDPATREYVHKDPTYKQANLLYKVARPPPPCSSAAPETSLGVIGEFEDLPQFGCIQYQGIYMLIATDNTDGVNAMRDLGVPPQLCDGSLAIFYIEDADSKSGPTILRVLRDEPVPVSVIMYLPYDYNYNCNVNNTPNVAFEAAIYVGQQDLTPFTEETLDFPLLLPPGVIRLGFTSATGPCQVTYGAEYSAWVVGQTNDIADSTGQNQTFNRQLVRYDAAPICVSTVGVDAVSTRDIYEDACAQLLFGTPAEQNEAVVTVNKLLPSETPSDDDVSTTTEWCNSTYQLTVENILPQVAIDFEADRSFLLASTEVKVHMDAVAANAASTVALEAALVSSGLVVARTIARSGLYRQQRLSSSMARSFACLSTAVVITAFNAPNFALIGKSLQNRGNKLIFTTASTRQYLPSNFSAVLLGETHAFVSVEGSSASAIIGLVLYAATLLVATYITWAEFTEIIKRKEEATRCLGHEALIADKHLLVEWRGTDSKLHDLLHPGAVKETGLAADIELMRRAVARKQLEGTGDVNGPASPGRYQLMQSPKAQFSGPNAV